MDNKSFDGFRKEMIEKYEVTVDGETSYTRISQQINNMFVMTTLAILKEYHKRYGEK